MAQGIHQIVGHCGYGVVVDLPKGVQFLEQFFVSSGSTELGGYNASLKIVDVLFTSVGEHSINVFRDGDPVVGAVPRESAFCCLPITRHVHLSLDRSGGGPRGIDDPWVFDTKEGSTDARIRTADDDPGGVVWVGSIQNGAVVGVRERETLCEVDDVVQGLFDSMELPLLSRGVEANGERQ